MSERRGSPLHAAAANCHLKVGRESPPDRQAKRSQLRVNGKVVLSVVLFFETLTTSFLQKNTLFKNTFKTNQQCFENHFFFRPFCSTHPPGHQFPLGRESQAQRESPRRMHRRCASSGGTGRVGQVEGCRCLVVFMCFLNEKNEKKMKCCLIMLN